MRNNNNKLSKLTANLTKLLNRLEKTAKTGYMTFVFKSASLFFCALFFASVSQALEFKSVNIAKAILYDAPSTEAGKLYIASLSYPVEIIVNLNTWIKIRDHVGALSWIETKHLSSKQTALVTANLAEIRQADDVSSSLLATLDKDVVLEVLPGGKNGWVKVKHRDGIVGYVQNMALWGAN